MSDQTEFIEISDVKCDINKGCTGYILPSTGKVDEPLSFQIDVGGIVTARGIDELSYIYLKNRGWFTFEQQKAIESFFFTQMTHACLITQIARIFSNVFDAVAYTPDYYDPEGDNIKIYSGMSVVGSVSCRVTYGAGAFGVRSVKDIKTANEPDASSATFPPEWIADLNKVNEDQLLQGPLDPELENEEAWK